MQLTSLEHFRQTGCYRENAQKTSKRNLPKDNWATVPSKKQSTKQSAYVQNVKTDKDRRRLCLSLFGSVHTVVWHATTAFTQSKLGFFNLLVVYLFMCRQCDKMTSDHRHQ